MYVRWAASCVAVLDARCSMLDARSSRQYHVSWSKMVVKSRLGNYEPAMHRPETAPQLTCHDCIPTSTIGPEKSTNTAHEAQISKHQVQTPRPKRHTLTLLSVLASDLRVRLTRRELAQPIHDPRFATCDSKLTQALDAGVQHPKIANQIQRQNRRFTIINRLFLALPFVIECAR